MTRRTSWVMAIMFSSVTHIAGAVELEKLVMPGPVIAGHADIEVDCDQCHLAFSRDKQADLCRDCHEDVATDQAAGTGFHGLDAAASTESCASCHTEHEGRDANVIILDTETFDHDFTDFLLLGAHLETDCVDCHAADTKYRDAPQACVECHEDDDEHRGGLGRQCADCHSSTEWQETRFDHQEHTGYALLGGHAEATCLACHVDYRYGNTPADCYACHVEDDPHNGMNGSDCAFCHTERRWDELLFDHGKETGFDLIGKHGDIACTDCHTDNNFDAPLEQDCVSCHRDNDEHDGLNGPACGDCHSPAGWPETTFDHAAVAAFPLLGAHAATTCASCHDSPMHEIAPPTSCFGCHRDDDPHDGQEGENCASCHNEQDWTTSVAFDHDLTTFPLIGQHRDTSCDACHESARFLDAPQACVDCHRDDDVHEAGLGTACGNCHNPNDWAFSVFDHARQTRFVLDGAHVDLVCESCHDRPLEKQNLSLGSCSACHRADDIHRGEFGSDCARCHNTRTFSGARRVQ
ncbi:MAG: cytochrome C [Gammaproteobacteria bacterium]|nr:cytochrome C [Gammaproteobacteria bacterium]